MFLVLGVGIRDMEGRYKFWNLRWSLEPRIKDNPFSRCHLSCGFWLLGSSFILSYFVLFCSFDEVGNFWGDLLLLLCLM